MTTKVKDEAPEVDVPEPPADPKVAAREARVKLAKEHAAAGYPSMGRIVVVKGLKVHATGSDEDPAVVNSASDMPVVPPVLTSPRIINGVPQLPPPPPPKPEAVLCYVALTLFPEGMAPRSMRNVPFFKTREDAEKFDLPLSTVPDQNVKAFWPDKY